MCCVDCEGPMARESTTGSLLRARSGPRFYHYVRAPAAWLRRRTFTPLWGGFPLSHSALGWIAAFIGALVSALISYDLSSILHGFPFPSAPAFLVVLLLALNW